jgi:hypothetical protein
MIIKKFSLFESEEERSYSYSELSASAKKDAIDNIREKMWEGEYGADDIPEWVVDDDYLFEPTHDEMIKVFGPDYNDDLSGNPMIGNTRENIYYNSKDDRSYYLHCKKAIDINDKEMFLGFLGFSPYYWDRINYYFVDQGTYTAIEFEIDEDELDEFSINDIKKQIEKAEEKFESHMSSVLDRITSSINYEYEDSAIIDRIESNDILFDKEGNPLE